jgi:four helix bundle protein
MRCRLSTLQINGIFIISISLTAKFPVEERYGLAQQMRRAAVSIPSNIDEGAGRNGAKEFLTPMNRISAL